MLPYSSLSFPGKLRRLHLLAQSTLTHYDLPGPQLTYHAFATNLLYRIDSSNGERFMLRLAYPGWRTITDLQSEALWLEALNRDTSIGVPSVVPARSGEYVLPMSAPGIDGAYHATLMRWLPGRLLGNFLTPRNLARMGELFAELHYHGASWKPPQGFTSRRFEHWLSRGEPDLLSQYAQTASSAQVGIIIDRVLQQVEGAYASLDRSDLRVIHCDLWHDNIKLYRGQLYPFDFEDTIWGFRVHDIAMAMLDLLTTVGDERYPGLLAAFRQGYSAHLSWPTEPLEPFQAGRLLWKLNWIARFQPAHFQQQIDRYTPVFENFLQNGNF